MIPGFEGDGLIPVFIPVFDVRILFEDPKSQIPGPEPLLVAVFDVRVLPFEEERAIPLLKLFVMQFFIVTPVFPLTEIPVRVPLPVRVC